MLVRGIQLRVRHKTTSSSINLHLSRPIGEVLNGELSQWLGQVDDQAESYPINDCKAIIAPFVSITQSLYYHSQFLGCYRHAGYSYSGPAAAWAYKSIDTSNMFVLMVFRRQWVNSGFLASVFLSWVLRTTTISKAVLCPSAQNMRHLSGIYRSI